MKKIYTVLLSSFVLISCGTQLQYLGGSYTPTKNVDVFVDAASITKPYTVMGKGYVEQSPLLYTLNDVQSQAITLARQKGADAILFQDYYMLKDGANIESVTSSDSTGTTLRTTNSTTVRPVVTTKMDILFLKYK